eukprot:Colp12_sorted_trinity150504_noHs@12383
MNDTHVESQKYSDRTVLLSDVPQLKPYSRWEKLKAYWKDPKNVLLAIYMILGVFAAAANTIMFKKMLNAYSVESHNYEFFVNQWNVFLYLVIALAIYLYKSYFTNDITPEQRQMPKKIFVFMGFLDSFSGFLGAIGGAYTDGSLQTILNQSLIPITLLLSVIFLKMKYQKLQYMGAAIMMAGAALACVPSFNGSNQGTTKVYSVLIFFAGIIPSAFSNVYKEKQFKDQELDVQYLTVWVTLFQVLFGFAFLPLLSVPGFGGVEFKQLPYEISDGFQCFLGEDPRPDDDCKDGTWTMMAYVAVNFLYNLVLLMITKHGSALLLVITSALSLPVCNLAFTSEALMGSEAEAFSLWNVFGLVLVVVGFLVYSALGRADDFLVSQGPPGQQIFTPVHQAEEEAVSRRNSISGPIPIPGSTRTTYGSVNSPPDFKELAQTV